jgi:hypothetical protein
MTVREMMPRSLAQCPNLPPQQSSEHQVKIGGQIRLAYAGGRRVGTHHEKTTSGKRGDTLPHQFPEPSLHPVANHRRANRAADNKAYLWHGVALYLTDSEEQMSGDHGTTGSAARAQRALELRRASHP